MEDLMFLDCEHVQPALPREIPGEDVANLPFQPVAASSHLANLHQRAVDDAWL